MFIPQCYGKTIDCEVVKTDATEKVIPTICKPYILILHCKDTDGVKSLKDRQKVKVKIIKEKLEGC